MKRTILIISSTITGILLIIFLFFYFWTKETKSIVKVASQNSITISQEQETPQITTDVIKEDKQTLSIKKPELINSSTWEDKIKSSDTQSININDLELKKISKQMNWNLSVDQLKEWLILKLWWIQTTLDWMTQWEKRTYFSQFNLIFWNIPNKAINESNYNTLIRWTFSYLYINKEYTLLQTILEMPNKDIINWSYLIQLKKKRKMFNEMLLTL